MTVSRANGLIGQNHAEALSALLADAEAGKVAPNMESLSYMMAACVPPTIEHAGFEDWPPSLDEFVDLPEVFIDEWYGAVKELNPHWWALPVSEDEAVKKAMSSTQS